MEYCDYLIDILKVINCCKKLPTHEHGVSFDTIIFSESSSDRPVNLDLDSLELLDSTFIQKPFYNITRVAQPAINLAITTEDSMISINEYPEQIWEAVDNNDFEVVQSYILSQDISSLEDSAGFTLLHRSVIAGNIEITEVLIGKIEPNARDNLGRTALHYACIGNNLDLAEELIKFGSDPSVVDNFGKTAKDYCKSERSQEHNFFLPNSPHSNIEHSSSTRVENSLKAIKIVDSFNENPDEQTRVGKRSQKHVKTLDSKKVLNKMQLEEFEVIKLLEKNPYGEIHLIENLGEKIKYAMKIIEKSKIADERIIKQVKSERKILSEFKHPFINQLHFSFQTAKKIIFVLDYCEEGSFENKLYFPMQIYLIRLYASELILALEYIHEKGYIYRSLNPKNILVSDQGHLLLSNFLMTVHGIGEDDVKNQTDFIQYLPPEVVNGDPYGQEVDWYMLGKLLNDMASSLDNKEDHIQDELESLNDIIKSLVQPVPWKRLGYSNGAKDLKSHIFFKSIDWDLVYSGSYLIKN